MSNTKKVCIDAGHYAKYNRCPNNSNYYESEVMWKLHLLQKKYLEQMGIEVITTRSDQTKDLALYTRGTKSKGCDLFISDHSNAVGSAMNESVDYPVAYATINGKADAIAKLLVDCVEDVMGTKQSARVNHRTGSNGDYYGVLRGAAAVGTPGLILEHSFHTNSKAVAWLLNDENLDKLAKAEAECIAKYLGINATINKTETQKSNVPFMIKVDKVEKGDVLNIRKEPNAKATITGKLAYDDPNTYTIVEVNNGWGKLKSGIGWISLHYTKTVSGTTSATKVESKPATPAPAPVVTPAPAPKPVKSLDEWAKEVINGKHGSGHENREASLKKAGCQYDYQTVRNRVNELCGVKTTTVTKSLEAWAKEVINGKHGVGHANREASLKKAGCTYPYAQVRAKVNSMYK